MVNKPTADKKPTFVIPKPKERVDPEALEKFASNAGAAGEPAEVKIKNQPAPISTSATSADRSKGFLLRLLPEQFERIEQVFAHSTFKSKQKMGEHVLMEAIDDFAKKLGIQ